MKPNNRTVLDLNKVQHATFWYVNQYGQTCPVKPILPTVRGRSVSKVMPAYYHPDWPGETEFDRARRLCLLDQWKPVVQFQLTANHNIIYTGKKAMTMWEAWKAKIFGKNK